MNSISNGKKNEQKRQEIENTANVILPEVENSVEFRTNKPLSTQKKMGKLGEFDLLSQN